MENVHPPVDHPDPQPRLNLLLTRDRAYGGEHWSEQLPRLLEPQGVWSYVVATGEEAIEAAEQMSFHAAVIDLATPVAPAGGHSPVDTRGGIWILQLFQRMPNPPAAVVVHNRTDSHRQLVHLLHEALRLGAFSVLNEPVDLEQLLDVFRRVLERRHRGVWPATQGGLPRESDDESAAGRRHDDET